ncbi:MAG: Trk system potassium transporter TrkA [Clostridia bacterium]|nr:Trk system potassium transporter TrkA [Clostridia bacterium]
MKIVVIGNGALGDALISCICNEGHSVTVVDENVEEVNEVVNKYDVLGVCGNGASVDVQKNADVENADVVISVTAGDELNILCCMIAKQLGAKHTIARVRDPRYLKQSTFMSNSLGIDMIVNPEFEAAREASRLIRFPAAMKIEKFAKGQVEVVDISITKGHPLCDLPLISFKSKYNTDALVCAARRGDEAIIPGGDFVITEGDVISIAASRKDMTSLFKKLGIIGKQIKDVMIVGGGAITRYLTRPLIDGGFDVKVIESSKEICLDLAEQFPHASIICGDATDPDLLDEEGIDQTDACVAMTSNDHTNFIISMFAKTRNVEKVISKAGSESFVKLSKNAGVISNITPHLLVSSKVLRYVRGLANIGEDGYLSAIKSLHRMVDGRVEAIEFDVAEDFDAVGVPLREIKIKKNVLIVAIIREGTVIHPGGNTSLELGDGVIVMTTNEHTCDLGDILL